MPRTRKPTAKIDGSIIVDPRNPALLIRRFQVLDPRDGKRKRLQVRGESWADCEAKRLLKLDELAALARPAAATGTVAALCDAWFAYACRSKGKALAPATEKVYRQSIIHITGQIGDLPVAELDTHHVDEMLLTLAESGLGERALGQVRMNLGQICKWARKTKRMSRNPVEDVEMPGGVTESRERAWFDLDEYGAVKAHLADNPSTIHTLLLVMLMAGLRPSEAWGLRWDAIDFTTDTLNVETTMRLGRDGRYALSTTLKTDRRNNRCAHRPIQMAPELRAALWRERSEQFANGITDRCFGGVTKSAIRSACRRVTRTVGVKELHPNGYRHTFASICRNRHMPYEQLAKLMGHKNTRMLILVYSHPVEAPGAVDMAHYLAS